MLWGCESDFSLKRNASLLVDSSKSLREHALGVWLDMAAITKTMISEMHKV